MQSEIDVEAVETQRANMPNTAPWREGVDEVVIQTSNLWKRYPELHAKAKAGDKQAATKLVKIVVKPEKIKALVEQHPNAKVAFVHAEESAGTNRLPSSYAMEFEKQGLEISDIVQTNKPVHTNADKVGRFVRRARFDGEVEPGREYIIVDDHVTMGGTLRDLKDYIESKGGKVVAVSTLTASAGGTKLRPTIEQIHEFNNLGVTNEQLKELGIANGFEGLTRSEARQILVLANPRGNQGASRGRKSGIRVDEERVDEGAQRKEVAREDAVPYGTDINQGFGSAGTSLNQVASAMRKINWQPGTVNVDIGGGRFDKATDYLRDNGVENLVFDPFNRNAKHNKAVAERVRDEKVDTVTCNNVLNVIDSSRSRANVILQAAKALKKGGTAYFSVYEGDKSSVSRCRSRISRHTSAKTQTII